MRLEPFEDGSADETGSRCVAGNATRKWWVLFVVFDDQGYDLIFHLNPRDPTPIRGPLNRVISDRENLTNANTAYR